MPPELLAVAAWRRLDLRGHDAAYVVPHGDGWRLAGVAAFRAETGPVGLAYEVVCGPDWTTRSGAVRGFVGDRTADWRVERAGGRWTFDGRPVDGLDGCVDLDFGFTPATNFTQVRRIDLPVGAAAEVPVAWLDVDGTALVRLPQTYGRRTATTYAYEAPRVGYAALLEFAPDGFVRLYPDLWEAEG